MKGQLLRRLFIFATQIQIFLKSQEMSKQFDSDAEKVSYSSDYLKHRLQFVDFRYGRPSIREIVHQEVKEARNSIGFITCGAPKW